MLKGPKRVKQLCFTAVFTALIFLCTAYLHIPSHTGYIHVGDGVLFLAACFLPLPYAVFSGVCSAVLADLVSGFAVWAPASAVIKAVTACLFSCKDKKLVTKRNGFAVLPAALVCIGGYYLYEALLFGNFIAPLAGILGSVMQSVFSALLFLLLGTALDKVHTKERLMGGNGI